MTEVGNIIVFDLVSLIFQFFRVVDDHIVSDTVSERFWILHDWSRSHCHCINIENVLSSSLKRLRLIFLRSGDLFDELLVQILGLFILLCCNLFRSEGIMSKESEDGFLLSD